MIKFTIEPKILADGRCKFVKVFKKMFFDIFLDILNKTKENLGQELVKRGL